MKVKTFRMTLDSEEAENNNPYFLGMVEVAQKACAKAYAPYSKFKVGACLRTVEQNIITGTNQENASYPCGMCAERAALYFAASQLPGISIADIVIAAEDKNGPVKKPITPCGACRQALLEYEKKQPTPIHVYMVGSEEIWEACSIADLLPLSFDKGALKK